MDALAKLICESMQRYCGIYKASDGKWYMDLADHEYADYEEANTYGPFDSSDQAMDYLDNFPTRVGGLRTIQASARRRRRARTAAQFSRRGPAIVTATASVAWETLASRAGTTRPGSANLNP